jgi:hypothetical protein
MSISHVESSLNWQERRKHPRYFVGSGLTLAIDDAGLQESIGLAEPDDISIGGVRVRNLTASENVKVGDRLELLLLDCEDAFSLRGEVVHHATAHSFGVEFQNLTPSEIVAVGSVIDRLQRYSDT